MKKDGDSVGGNERLEPWVAPEMEVRLVALAAGEASEFEAAELRDAMEAEPELRAFYDRIVATDSLLGEIVREGSAEAGDEWKMDSRRRSALISSLGGTPGSTAPAPLLGDMRSASAPGGQRFDRWWHRAAAVAALLVATGAMVSLVIGPGGTPMADSIAPVSGVIDESLLGRDYGLAAEPSTSQFGRKFSRENRWYDESSRVAVEQKQPEEIELGKRAYATWSEQPDAAEDGFDRHEKFLFADLESESIEGEIVQEVARSRARLAKNSSVTSDRGGEADWEKGANLTSLYSTVDTKRPQARPERLPILRSTGETDFQTEIKRRDVRAVDAVASDDLAALDVAAKIATATEVMRFGVVPKQEAALAELEEGFSKESALGEQLSTAGFIADGGIALDAEAEGLDVAKYWDSQPRFDYDIPVETEPVSTFSLHVGDVSFQLAASALLENGTWPEGVRIEEFVNAFDYLDSAVPPGQPIGCVVDEVLHPFIQQRSLLRIALQTAATGRETGRPLGLTVLLDKSGSMERGDREEAVSAAFRALSNQLAEGDVISVVGFARQPRLIADRIGGERGEDLNTLVEQAPSEGGTNLEAALKLAGEVALRQKIDGGINRIVLMTDGAANLGDASPDSLRGHVVDLRRQGIAFDACGVGADGLNDDTLEALTRDGDGRYYFLSGADSADDSFVSQLAGALRPAAKNVKVQVEFDPKRVRHYRLLGFENHRLDTEDFRDDSIDAAELAATESGVAVYQIEEIPGEPLPLGRVSVRFEETEGGNMIERSWAIPGDELTPPLSDAVPAVRLAAVAALFAERLAEPDGAGATVDLAELGQQAAGLRDDFPGDRRVQKLTEMIEAARRLTE